MPTREALKCSIGEILLYIRPVDSHETLDIGGYLQSKWGRLRAASRVTEKAVRAYPFAGLACLFGMTSEKPLPLHDLVQRPWRTFLEQYEPLRPDLYRYCRFLTRSPWDAEDLVQDVLARAFVTLGGLSHAPPNPRAWLFRVASNRAPRSAAAARVVEAR